MNKISSMLDSIADRLEAQGLMKEAYEIDKIADEVEAFAIDPAEQEKMRQDKSIIPKIKAIPGVKQVQDIPHPEDATKKQFYVHLNNGYIVSVVEAEDEMYGHTRKIALFSGKPERGSIVHFKYLSYDKSVDENLRDFIDSYNRDWVDEQEILKSIKFFASFPAFGDLSKFLQPYVR